jgi:hypothetical protein
MASSKTAQLTDFTVDILGRYMCNGLDEALHSIDKNAQRPDGSPQSDARPFNAIIIGGGSFGGVLAQHLLYADKTNSYRILVLEGGRHSLPEHFQNLPLNGQPGSEVWGLAWRTNVAGGFPGLAYTVGGRSLFFGGWSPRQLDSQGALALPKRLLKVPLRSACFATPGQLSLEETRNREYTRPAFGNNEAKSYEDSVSRSVVPTQGSSAFYRLR